MDEERACSACGACLIGPFDPGIALSVQLPPDERNRDGGAVTARAWICPACGLTAWYVDDQDLDKLADVEPALETSAKPAASYARRYQMMRMLRRVRRM
jgi:hypothetical protein